MLLLLSLGCQTIEFKGSFDDVYLDVRVEEDEVFVNAVHASFEGGPGFLGCPKIEAWEATLDGVSMEEVPDREDCYPAWSSGLGDGLDGDLRVGEEAVDIAWTLDPIGVIFDELAPDLVAVRLDGARLNGAFAITDSGRERTSFVEVQDGVQVEVPLGAMAIEVELRKHESVERMWFVSRYDTVRHTLTTL